MAPKKKEKKNKKKKEKKVVKITKSQYVAQIAERNAVLANARKRIKIVEDNFFNTESKYEQVKEDLADIIDYLKHEIEINKEEIAEYDEQIEVYKKEISDNDKYYESIFAKMESEFEEKNRTLQHRIQQTNAKLFASEEMRQQRKEHLRKKEELEKKLQEAEARHELEIYEAEKSVIIKQDTIQKDMEKALTTLANDFAQATDITIGETTNKLIRDNITLGNELTCTQEIIDNAREQYQKVRVRENQLKCNAELLNDEHDLILERHNLGVNHVELLIKSNEELQERIIFSQKLIKENRRLKRQILEKECILKEKTEDLTRILKILEENKEGLKLVKNTYNTYRKYVVHLELLLCEAAKKAKAGVDIENIKRLEERDEESSTKISKEEQEDNLKEFKYKSRETTIDDIIKKLSSRVSSDLDMRSAATSSEFQLTSFPGSFIN